MDSDYYYIISFVNHINKKILKFKSEVWLNG